MHKSPLHTLQEIAHTRVDDATRRLGELIASEHACEEKLTLLIQYRTEYRERFIAAAKGGIDPNAWRNYSAFLLQLDDAVLQQQNIVNRSKNATSTGQQRWVSEHTRAKALDTLSLRQQLQQVRKENKQEQHMSDEHAAKHYLADAEEH